MTWLRQLLDWQRDVSGPQEFVESFKTDVFRNQVFVYTPKGDLKELPTGRRRWTLPTGYTPTWGTGA